MVRHHNKSAQSYVVIFLFQLLPAFNHNPSILRKPNLSAHDRAKQGLSPFGYDCSELPRCKQRGIRHQRPSLSKRERSYMNSTGVTFRSPYGSL